MRRSFLLSTTAVVGLCAAMAHPAFAADGPAVSQTNFTFDAGGGGIAHKGVGYAGGGVAIPLSHSTGFQLDGSIGDWQGKAFEGVAAHLFWRNPSVGMIGLYGEYLNSDAPRLITTPVTPGNSTMQRAAVEGELYLDRFSFEARAGVEGGTVGSRFYDRANIAFYPVDNFRMALGQIEEAGEGVGTFTVEYQPDQKAGASLFAEALESHNIVSAFAGVRFYFGAGDKSLMAHAREDDPGVNFPEDLLGIGHAVHHSNAPVCHNFEGAVIPCDET